MILAILLWQSRRKTAEQQEVDDYFATQSTQIEKDAWQNLRKNFTNGDTLKIRKAIIDWGKIFWKDEQLSTLDGLAKKFNSKELKVFFDELDAAIFGSKPNPTTDNLLALLENLRKTTKKGENEILDRLYPD